MYAARALSMYRKDPSILSLPPTEARLSSGYLTFIDEETEEEDTCCWGVCKLTRVKQFPFPQNKILEVQYTIGTGQGAYTEVDKVFFIPVLDQPLSSNRYYIIRADGKNKGLACKCSREEDMGTCFCCNFVKDVKPSVLDYRDIYQQVEIVNGRFGFYAKSVAPDGFPPLFLKRKGWTVHTSNSLHCQLKEAPGLNFSLRKQQPDLQFPISNKHSTTIVVGRWYCPFIFIKEEMPLKDQMKSSTYYEMTLEQFWEKIYACENDYSKVNHVVVSIGVKKEVASVFGLEVAKEDKNGVDGFISYWNTRGSSLGMSLAIVEKMRRLVEMGGWVGGEEALGKVERVEEFKGGNNGGWKKFGCFVLAERFSLRRMDGSLVLTHDFRHLHHILSKWE